MRLLYNVRLGRSDCAGSYRKPPLSGVRGSLGLGSTADFRWVFEVLEMDKRIVYVGDLKMSRTSSSAHRPDMYDHFFLTTVECPRA